MKLSIRNSVLSLVMVAGVSVSATGVLQAAEPRPITGYRNVDQALQVLGTTCGMGSLTAARVIDNFILALAPDLARGEKRDTTAFGNMVQQLQKQDELQQYGYKGPVRRFLDRYCIIGYLTGSGSCDSGAAAGK